jgi:hypothetical protein
MGVGLPKRTQREIHPASQTFTSIPHPPGPFSTAVLEIGQERPSSPIYLLKLRF